MPVGGGSERKGGEISRRDQRADSSWTEVTREVKESLYDKIVKGMREIIRGKSRSSARLGGRSKRFG